MKIIAIDDNSDALELLIRCLKDNHPQSDVAGFLDPKQAIIYSQVNSVDFAFLEINLKGLDGLTVAKRLRRLNPHIGITFVTQSNEYAVDAFRMHANGYLLKPVTREALKNA